MKQFFKTWYFSFCYGLSLLLSFFGRKDGPVVLMYHAVNIEGGKLSVSPETFREQMKFLHEERSVVGMEDLLLFLNREKELTRRSVVVTIDDGYLDTYREAFPILKEFKIPFTLFLTTELRVMPELANLPRPTWDQLREMSAVGIATIGLHGHEHLHVGDIAGNPALLDKELGEPAMLIEKEIGKPPRVYAYAFGARDSRIPAYLQRIGITAAFGITDGTVTPSKDRYALPRVQIDSTMSERLFRYRTTSAVEVASLMKRNLRRWTSPLWKKSP